jgi:GNAT superfamily N-acetyltransferase
MVAFWLVGMKSIPVAYVSIKGQQGVTEDKIFNQNFSDELLESDSKKDPEEYKKYLIKTLPSIMRFLKNSVSGWTPSVEQMLDAIDIAYNVMKDTGDIKLAGKAFNDELNKLYKISQNNQDVSEDHSNDDLEIINKVESSFHNGYHGVLIAKTPERQVGYLSYSIYNDVPQIEMIYVAQDYRRHGVAKKMLKALQKISPDEEIIWGYTTDDGTNLKKSIDFIKKPNPEIIKKKAKLAGIQSKLARLNIKLEKLMDTNPELARRFVQTVGDRWNKLNDIEHRLKDELYSSKGEYSKFIPETEK